MTIHICLLLILFEVLCVS